MQGQGGHQLKVNETTRYALLFQTGWLPAIAEVERRGPR
jgi:hypothetical protein